MKQKPIVGIIMGSKSDEPIVEQASQTLKQFGIPYEVKIMSAHRTPKQVQAYARNAKRRNIEVIIAAAGKAAHLPGVVASLTTIPVIGIPIKTSDLAGLDSLLSIAQMPTGVPVATVAINGAKNAALLAMQILSLKYPQIKKKFAQYKKSLAQHK